MANEFKVKKGLIVAGATGGTALDVQGSQGQLFSVTDDLSGSIFAVSDISGVPILDVNSSGLSTFDGDVNLPDSKKILLGTGNDFQLYHDGTHGVLNNTTGNLYTSALGSIIFRTSLNVTALTLDTSQNATFAGTLTAPTFLGDLNGTINTATTGTTQTAGNNSTLIATTAYADAAAAAVPIGNYLPLAAGSGSPLTGNLYLEGAAQNIRINNGTQPVVFLGDGGANTDGQLILYSSTGGANVVFSGDTQNHYITNGNVGIGTTSPSTKLHIVQPGGSSQLTLERTGSSAGKAVLAGAAEGLIVYDGLYGAKMYVGTSGTYNGNVGIGTISPDAQLEISNSTITDGSGGATLRLTRADNTSVAGDPVGTIEFYSTDADGPKTTAYIKSMSEELYGRKGSLAFGTSITNNADAVEAMRINSSGNVGIGTTSPIVNLQVGDGTTDTESRFYHNDASYTSVRGYGIWMSRFASYFRPVTTNTQTLYVGHTSNVWNAISNNANTHVFSTGANERMRITSTGNVGIGTTSPGTKLTISGGDDAAAIGVLELITSGGTNLKFGGNNGYSWIQSHASKPLYINQLGNNVILNSGGGNVGIGTTSPSTKLYVDNGESTFNRGNSAGTIATFRGQNASKAVIGTTTSYFTSNVGIGTTTPNAKLDVQGTQGQLFSVTDDLSGDIFSVADISGVPIMTVNSNGTSYFDGNVGIGTDSPGSKLQVGDYMASNVLTIGGWYGGGGGTLAFKSGYVPNAAYVWDTARIKATDDGNFNGRIEFQTTASGGNAGGSPTTKMVLKANGNVGIGTTSPKGKLQINGNGNAWNDAPSVRLWDTTNSKGWLVGNVNNYTAGDFYIRTFATVNTDPTSTSQEFTIKHATGNVGIGTTSPDSMLHVARNGNSNGGTILMGSKGNATNKWSYLAGAHYNQDTGSGNGTGSAGMAIIGSLAGETYNRVYIGGGPYEINAATQIDFWTHSGTLSTQGGSQRGYVDNGGNWYLGNTLWVDAADDYVGIGTTTPESKLEVNVIDDGFDDIDVLRLKRTWSTGSGSDRAHGILFNDLNSRMATIYADRTNSAGNYNSQLLFSVNSGASGTSMITPMVINNLGRVGIGTTSPSTDLQVIGTVRADVFGVQDDSTNPSGNTSTRVTSPAGATYDDQSNSASTGVLSVILPTVAASTMLSFTIRVFDYANNESFDVNVAGYWYGSNLWTNTSVRIESQGNIERNFNVRFGKNNTTNKGWVGIGETTTNWSYVKFAVLNFQAAHVNDDLERWNDLWDTAVLTSLTGYTTLVTKNNNQVNNWARNGENLYYGSGSGNVGIGTFSPSAKLDVDGDIIISDSGDRVFATDSLNGAFELGDIGGLNDEAVIQGDGTFIFLKNAGNTTLTTTVNNRVGIGTSGPGSKLDILGATNTSNSSLLRVRTTDNPNAPEKVVGFYVNTNTERGFISVNQYSTAYSTSSDYRLKENIVPIPNGIERLKELKPCRFNFIQGDPNYVVDGFIAHEAAEVIPEAVTGEKDAVDEDNNPAYQGIDQSKIVPLLTAALQEAISKIEQLETRIQTLENN